MRYLTPEQFQKMRNDTAKASRWLDNIAGQDERPDFHQLTSSQVDTVLHFADVARYRRPKNANGSRARYFYAYLLRLESRSFKAYAVFGEVAR